MLAQQLRHAGTRLLPIAIAERVQHTIVRIEQLLGSGVVDTVAADAIVIEARKLLEELRKE